MFEDNLLTLMKAEKKTNTGNSVFIEFLNRLEGWKTRCKNLHWSAYRKNTHEYLDDFLEILDNYQDGLAEGYMGIVGKLEPSIIEGIKSNAINPKDLILEIRNSTIDFYNKLPQETIYKGITSECETFIQNLNKYKYLFDLCDVE